MGATASLYRSTYNTTVKTTVGTIAQTGTTWGAATDSAQRRVLLSAYVRRHTGLYESPAGTPHPGQLFSLGFDATSPTPFVDLAALGVSVGTVASNSARAYDAGVCTRQWRQWRHGRGWERWHWRYRHRCQWSTLGAVTFDRHLYRVALPSNGAAPTASDVSDKGAITAPCPAGSGIARPFGLKPYNGLIYLGVVCDGSIAPGTNRANLEAYVVTFDPTANTFAPFFGPIELNYAKGCVANTVATSCQWYAWGTPDNAAPMLMPTPLLSDIEFDIDGSLILNFRDQNADQYGGPASGFSGGDVLRVCRTGSGYTSADYTLQGETVVPIMPTMHRVRTVVNIIPMSPCRASRDGTGFFCLRGWLSTLPIL